MKKLKNSKAADYFALTMNISQTVIIYFYLYSLFFQPFDWIRNYIHFRMNEVKHWEELLFYKTKWPLFWVWQTGCTQESETRAKLIPNLFCVQIQDSAELTPESTFKVYIVGL